MMQEGIGIVALCTVRVGDGELKGCVKEHGGGGGGQMDNK
jgi:hypothetical protein